MVLRSIEGRGKVIPVPHVRHVVLSAGMSSTGNIKYPNNRKAVSERQVDLYNNLTCNQPSVFPSESLPIPQRSYRDSGPRTSVSRGGLRLSWRSIAAELMGSNLKADFREGGSQAAIFRYNNQITNWLRVDNRINDLDSQIAIEVKRISDSIKPVPEWLLTQVDALCEPKDKGIWIANWLQEVMELWNYGTILLKKNVR